MTGGAISREYKDRAVGAGDGECGERDGGDREGKRGWERVSVPLLTIKWCFIQRSFNGKKNLFDTMGYHCDLREGEESQNPQEYEKERGHDQTSVMYQQCLR
jgi:hypothetical protein